VHAIEAYCIRVSGVRVRVRVRVWQGSKYKRLCYGRGTARCTCQYKFCNYKTSHL